MKPKFFDLQAGRASADISLFFPGWRPGGECVAVFSPHDDDAIIGAGYAVRCALSLNAPVYICIFCDGEAGYTEPSLAGTIVQTRGGETVQAYETLGVPRDNIIRFGYHDFSLGASIGWKISGGQGTFAAVVPFLREKGVTRLLLPNGYREHSDHTAAADIGAFDAPQAGDPILPDWGLPTQIRTVTAYSVWSDFSPEDMLVNRRAEGLRANLLICAPPETETLIREGIAAYKSQGPIIADMISRREERFSDKASGYVEPYLRFDPRPKLDLKPYLDEAEKILDNGGGK
jgi:LmbE family N-acetylglucosaminyl deacetylase